MFLLLGILATVYLTEGAFDSCPSGLTHNQYLREFGGACYQFVTYSHPDWAGADSACKHKGGYLVDIQSAAEQDFVYKTLHELQFHGDKGVWLGLTDKTQEGAWGWVSGAPFKYTHWEPGQPSSLVGGLEDCALMEMSTGTWHDYPCHGFIVNIQHHAYVCKFGTTTSGSSTSMPISSTMPPSTMAPTTVLPTTMGPTETSYIPSSTTAPVPASTTPQASSTARHSTHQHSSAIPHQSGHSTPGHP